MIRASLRRVGLLLAMLHLAMPHPAAAVPGEPPDFGCKSMANTTQLLALRRASDPTPYDERLQRLVRAGECRQWTATDPVIVEDESDRLVCLAPGGGRGICYWSVPGPGPAARP
ncbi:hypothetical protein [Methylobacterium sp. Leaf118]|uniref:hypothetical protein n=1 Tax=Methylobacterium sp. Leaf118 TaxID=2876562 RepID=UPI001E585B54|nr:hypothetical protein [Methylobacterium sp. Leaf118]